MLVAHHRHVIEPIHIGKRLNVGLVLGQLFSGPVQQADVRVCALHDFAVKLQHQAKHTVCGRMLGPKVQGIVFDFSHGGSHKTQRALSAGLRICLHE